jgi:hypothetical protein
MLVIEAAKEKQGEGKPTQTCPRWSTWGGTGRAAKGRRRRVVRAFRAATKSSRGGESHSLFPPPKIKRPSKGESPALQPWVPTQASGLIARGSINIRKNLLYVIIQEKKDPNFGHTVRPLFPHLINEMSTSTNFHTTWASP